MDKARYGKMVKKASPASPVLTDLLSAFVFGGTICTIGQFFRNLYASFDLSKDEVGMLVSVTLILIAVILTALKIFDRIAKHAGAGTLVPITGFANAVSSAAIEFKTEGFVLGTGAKMFTIAGPVIVYGVSASVVYGLIYYFCQFVF